GDRCTHDARDRRRRRRLRARDDPPGCDRSRPSGPARSRRARAAARRGALGLEPPGRRDTAFRLAAALAGRRARLGLSLDPPTGRSGPPEGPAAPRATYELGRGEAEGSAVVVDRAVHEPLLVRVPRRLGAVRDAELPVDVGQVELDGLLGDPQLLADRLV